MSDAELEAWHALVRTLQTPQTLAAHLREGTGVKREKKEPKVDISEYA